LLRRRTGKVAHGAGVAFIGLGAIRVQACGTAQADIGIWVGRIEASWAWLDSSALYSDSNGFEGFI
jgi:hypothetical protein